MCNMKAFPVLAVLVSCGILFWGCSKSFETKPRIEIKDYTATVTPGGAMTITLVYYDKEGDLDSIIGVKERLNANPPIGVGDYKADVFHYKLPEFNPKNTGEIAFTLPYDILNESTTFNDTVRFRFAVLDLGKNTSDTITSAVIVARQE